MMQIYQSLAHTYLAYFRQKTGLWKTLRIILKDSFMTESLEAYTGMWKSMAGPEGTMEGTGRTACIPDGWHSILLIKVMIKKQKDIWTGL